MRRVEWFLLFLLVAGLAADAWWRVRPQAEQGSANAGTEALSWTAQAGRPPPRIESVVPDLLGDPLPTPTPKLAAGAKPEGKVDEWFYAGRRLRLEAVFRRGGERIAVVVGDDGKGKDLQREQLRLGDRLADHIVVRVDRQALRLVPEELLNADGSPPETGGLELILFERGRGAVRLDGKS